MNRNNHHIDELFARELGNIEITPPHSIWQGIEKNLDKKKRTGIIYFRLGLAAGIALLVSLSGIYMFNTSAKKDKTIAITEESKVMFPLLVEKHGVNKIVTTEKMALSGKTKNATTGIDTHSNFEEKSIQKPENRKDNIISTSIAANSIDAVEKKQSQVNDVENKNSEEYLMPKLGIIAYNKPYSEPPIPANNNTNGDENIKTDAQYADLNPQIKINRWSIEGLVAPQYSYRTITSNSELNPEFNKNESGLISYSNAIKVNYAASKRFTVQAGIAYSMIGQTLKNIYVKQPVNNFGAQYRSMRASSEVNTSLGLINNSSDEPMDDLAPSSLQYTFFNAIGETKRYSDKNEAAVTTQSEFSIVQRMQVIEIPLMARYYIIAGKINWHFAGGISTNILIGNDAILKNNGNSEKIGETENLKRVNYTGLIGTGLGYSLRRNIILMVEPTFKYYLNSISSGNIKVHPYSFGIYTGICYKL